MIIKLQPNQITKLWDSIRYGVINAVAPLVDPTPDNIQDILCQLLRQDMQCWCVFDEDKNIQGYIVTSITIDTNTKFRTLIIYSLFLYEKVSMETWDKGMKDIEEFAKANNCSRVAAYTNHEAVLAIAKNNNYNTDYKYIIKDIGG